MDHYSTCLDRAFLPRGLALYRSLRQRSGPFTLWVLCLDAPTYEALRRLALPGVVPVEESEVLDRELEEARAGRGRREYYFACKPWLAQHVLLRDPEVRRVTHLDGDLYFFGDPAELMAEVEGASVALSPHATGRAAFEERFGQYNAGWISFRRDASGLAALEWWRQRNAEATPDYPVAGVFAEQKYLEELPGRFGGVVEVTDTGSNVAPWNLRRVGPVRADDVGRVWVGARPLTFFHFHSLDRWSHRVFGVPGPSAAFGGRRARAVVYRPYVEAVFEQEVLVAGLLGDEPRPPAPWGSTRPRPGWWRGARRVFTRASALLGGRVVMVSRAQVRKSVKSAANIVESTASPSRASAIGPAATQNPVA